MCTRYGSKRVYDIAAKPTKFKETEFRSRLEARWAVFFDALKVRYEYEKTTYSIDGDWYLPDFWLKRWIVEVKPTPPTPEEYYKAKTVSTESRIAIVCGPPNFNTLVYLLQKGEQLQPKLNQIEKRYCLARGYDLNQWLTLKMLFEITGKKDFYKAFERAERYQF